MSTKTIKQRIALIAASALTAGLFSVVSAPAVNAATSDGTEPNLLALATTLDGDGVIGTALTIAANQTFSQQGFVADTRTTSLTTDGAVYVTGSNTATAQVLAGAKIAFLAIGNREVVTDGLGIVVTGGTLAVTAVTNANGSKTTTGLGVVTAGNYAAGNSASTVFVADGGDAATTEQSHSNVDRNAVAGVFSVSAAVGSTATIAIYTGANIVDTDTATNGTLRGIWSLTVVAASAVGEYNASKSDLYQQPCLANATTGTSGTNIFDTTSACANGRVGVVYVDLDDVNGNNVTTGVLTATSSAGSITSSGVTTTGSIIAAATTGFATVTNDSDGRVWFYAKQPVANAGDDKNVTVNTLVSLKIINCTGTVLLFLSMVVNMLVRSRMTNTTGKVL